MESSSIVHIYALIDRHGNPNYIGSTDNLRNRKWGHRASGREFVEMIVVDECSQDDRGFWEGHYLDLYRSWGFKMTNRAKIAPDRTTSFYIKPVLDFDGILSAKFDTLADIQHWFPNEADCVAYLESIRWGRHVSSPFVSGSVVYKCAKGYKCGASNKYFNVKNGTIFANSNMPLRKWMMAVFLMVASSEGISSIQMASVLEVTQKTAWSVGHKIRHAFSSPGSRRRKKKEPEQVDCLPVEMRRTYKGMRSGHRKAYDSEYLFRLNPETTVHDLFIKAIRHEGSITVNGLHKPTVDTTHKPTQEKKRKDKIEPLVHVL